MTREEIKEELLNDKQQQANITIAATFTALYTHFINKGILKEEDITIINKLTDEYIDKINDLTVNKIMEDLEKE